MFDAQHRGTATHPMRLTPLSQLARDASLGLASERSYMVPVLFWVASGQGRYSVEGELRGYTASNIIFLPANTSHSIEVSARGQGMAIFFADRSQLVLPTAQLHLRLHGVDRQTEFAGLVEELRRESLRGDADREEALYHRTALLMLWLRRQGVTQPTSRDTQATDMLRSIIRAPR